MIGEGQINISEENKSFLWLPPKTGTMHATLVFSHLNFNTVGWKDNSLKVNFFRHNHSTHLFPGHENYKLICTARNPFTLLISEFKFFEVRDKKNFTSENFRKYFAKVSDMNFKSYFFHMKNRVPDYFIRVEHLYYDYIQIPFVRNSKLNKSGILYDLCQKKINATTETPVGPDFYTPDMIDRIYQAGGDYLKLLNYEFPY